MAIKNIFIAGKPGCGTITLIIVDELGKMWLFSPKFREVILKTLDSKNKKLGTIIFTSCRTYSGGGLKANPFCDRIK